VVVSRLNIWNLPRLFRIKVKVRVRLRIGGTPPYREWEHNASLSSLNSKKKFAKRVLAWWMYGLYRVPFFLLFFLIENAKSRKVVVLRFGFA